MNDVNKPGRDNKSVVSKEDLIASSNNRTVKAVLSRVFKFFLVCFGKDNSVTWDKLMDAYINNPENNIPSFQQKRTSIRGNMKREYLGPQLSWPKFCEAMKFADYKKLTIIFIAEDENGRAIKLAEEVNFDQVSANDTAEDLIKSRAVEISGDYSLDDIKGEDGKEIINRGKEKAKASVWLSKPISDIQSIIANNIVK